MDRSVQPKNEGRRRLLERSERAFDLALRWFSGTLIGTILVVLVLAVIGRKIGFSFSWYDEVAAILLAWLTYIGAALVALHRGHIGMDNLVSSLPPPAASALMLLRAAIVSAFFVILAWQGVKVMQAMAGFALITVSWMPVAATQSIIPIGSGLFILAELFATRRAVLGLPPLRRPMDLPQ